jgi:6-phosphogluconolactonase (cycloisomerase 2 family)
MTHGGTQPYYSKTGALYTGTTSFPMRSTDNGKTWQELKSALPSSSYFVVQGDGNNLYTAPSCACGGGIINQPYFTSPEDDGLTWTAYQAGAQSFGNGPYRMSFDRADRVVYSANWVSGIWALRVIDP